MQDMFIVRVRILTMGGLRVHENLQKPTQQLSIIFT